MEGDTPLDLQGCAVDYLSTLITAPEGSTVDDLYNAFLSGTYMTARDLKGRDMECVKEISRQYSEDGLTPWERKAWMHDDQIAAQVVAFLWMSRGAEISDEFKEYALRACREDLWAAVDEERRSSCDNFAAAIESYVPGTPYEHPTKGLFEAVFEKLS